MNKLLKQLKGKKIHIVGVTGAEGSNILRFLIKNNITGIITHDFVNKNSIEKSFKLWHKGKKTQERKQMFKIFSLDLAKTDRRLGSDYLKDIHSAEIIFVPQSWRLYKKQNQSLWKAKEKGIPFYSLTRIYLDYADAQIIGVTGTVGKGSVANLLVQLLKHASRRVYFAGNETWMEQSADKLDQMNKKDVLVLEISHRQLQDGYSRAPGIVVVTNIYPNHLDEVSWEEYQRLKLDLLKAQNKSDYCVLNYDIPQLRNIASSLKQNVTFFSKKDISMNTKSVQKIFNFVMNTKSYHYQENLLAACSTAFIFGLNTEIIKNLIPTLVPLGARLEFVSKISGISFYNDIKSTTPWSTIAALNKFSNKSVILICGGKNKNIAYNELAKYVNTIVKKAIFLKSQLSTILKNLLPQDKWFEAVNLEQAIKYAYDIAKQGDNVIVSPAAGFFYTDFIKGKRSIKKILTSLPLKKQV